MANIGAIITGDMVHSTKLSSTERTEMLAYVVIVRHQG